MKHHVLLVNPPHGLAMTLELTFSNFVLRANERQLLADGKPVTLGARAFDVLCVLVERAGLLVSKTQMFALVWPGLIVEENNLQVHISTLRKVLGPELIATVPGQEYRFTGLPVYRQRKRYGQKTCVSSSVSSAMTGRSCRGTTHWLQF